MEKIEITREQLYQRVWDKPLRQVAQEIGITDVGLKKACTRLSVPSPPRGYWAKLDAGKKVTKPDLPAPTDKTLGSTTITVSDRSDEPKITRFAGELDLKEVKVPRDLHNCHPLVSRTRKSFLESRYSHHGLHHASGPGTLSLDTSKEQMQRALRIYQAIIRTCLKLGWKIDSEENGPGLMIGVEGQEVSVKIREKTNRFEKETKYSWKEYDHVPSGVLILEITNYFSPVRMQKAWRDTNSQSLEEKLLGFIENVHLYACAVAQHRKNEAEKERRRQIEGAKRAREEKAQAIRDSFLEMKRQEYRENLQRESRYRDYLVSLAHDWRDAKLIESMVEEFERQDYQFRDLPWVQWARSVSKTRDPFLNGKLMALQYVTGLDAFIDCGQDVSTMKFPYPSDVKNLVEEIMREPLDA